MHVERVDFIALPVGDLARADAFYGETLGLARNPKSSGDRWVEYETGNLTLALSTFGGSLALGVSDVGDARQELEREDVEFALDTFDTGECRGAPFTDRDGNRLQLHKALRGHMAFFKDGDGNGLMLHHRYAPYADGTEP